MARKLDLLEIALVRYRNPLRFAIMSYGTSLEQMMKVLFLLTVLLGTTALLTGADQVDVVYVAHDKVDAALANKADIHLVTADNLMVEGNYRNKAGVVEVHEKLTDIFYVTDGSTTFVAGGTLEGGKLISPGQIRGETIHGGQIYHLVKGDAIVIPAGIPHWFKEVPTTVSYFVVKVIKQ
jgi:mannose-6-phosphate isomerase-like protein (cupin superfamily)